MCNLHRYLPHMPLQQTNTNLHILNPGAVGGHRPPMVNHLGVLSRQCTVALSVIIHGPQGIDDCIGVMATTCKIPY